MQIYISHVAGTREILRTKITLPRNKSLQVAQILVRCPWFVVFIKQWPEIGSLGNSKAILALFIETIDAGDKYACKDRIISTSVESS
jgi:hypothetical protein